MRKIFTLALAGIFSFTLGYAQETCGTATYVTSNAGWSDSEWYQIIDMDAGLLTDPTLPQFTAADGSKNALEADFKSGSFETPVMKWTDESGYIPAGVNWPINYYLAAFAPTQYTSAYAKTLIGVNPSSDSRITAACSMNDNTVVKSNIFDKPGFIELSRHAPTTEAPKVSRHGVFEIDNLPAVERIQWSYSATSSKRGVKADIRYGNGEWQPLRWEASGLSSSSYSISTFAEQGYQFEEIINLQDFPDSLISFRIRIWDGDSIHINPLSINESNPEGSTYTTQNYPFDYYSNYSQTVRVHQLKIFSGIVPDAAPSAVIKNEADKFKVSVGKNRISFSETADIRIYGLSGNLIFEGYSRTVNTSNFSRGIYILKAETTNGGVTRKIVI